MDVRSDINVLYVEEIEELAQRLESRERCFTLFLAWDAPTEEQTKLREIMQPLVDRGLVYFCAWGRGCEAVHDAVDRCDIERENHAAKPELFIMTTWHHDEPLEEAVWFFKELALPNETHGVPSFDRFAVAVGNREWSDTIKRVLSELETE
jgi:hypothetical protein